MENEELTAEQVEINDRLESAAENNFESLGSAPVCKRDSCSCTGYTSSEEPGKCGCGHYGYDHL